MIARILAVLAGLAVLAAVVTRASWWPLLGAMLGADAGPPHYLGYVEGETLYIAAPVAGRLVERPAQRGATLRKGETVFRLDPAAARAELARAAAALAESRAQQANLLTGKRAEEQEVTRAQRREAEAALGLAEKDLARTRQLVVTGAAPRSQLDLNASQVDQLHARVAQLQAQEAAGDLAARPHEIQAAEARVIGAEASLVAARTHLDDLAPVAPLDALVEDVFFDAGEWVAAGQPVAALLPPGKVRLRFFVPEGDIARAVPGTRIGFTCDGCPAGLGAVITHVAPRAEFTPPVIYSRSARYKLVHLVEAAPQGGAALPVGLPIEVAPLPARP